MRHHLLDRSFRRGELYFSPGDAGDDVARGVSGHAFNLGQSAGTGSRDPGIGFGHAGVEPRLRLRQLGCVGCCSFGLGLGRHSSAASSSLLTALAEAGTGSNNHPPAAAPTPAASSAGTTAAASSTSSSSSSSSLAAAAAAEPESECALFSFPYAGGSFAGEGKALGGGFKKSALGLNLGLKNKGKGVVSAAEEARDAWTDLVAVTTSLAQAKGAGGHDEKQDGKQLPQQEEEGQGGGLAAAVAVEAPRALCSIM